MALQEKTQKFSGTSRGRVWCPGGACEVEAASPQWNNVLRPSLHFVNSGSGAGDGLVRLGCAGCGNRVGVPHLRTPCTGVLYWFLAEVQVLVSSSSLVSLLVVFLCLLLLWIGSAGQEMASGSARSTNPTADAWLRRMCCSLPKFGVRFWFWGTDGGGLSVRCARLRVEKHRRLGQTRKKNSCLSSDWVVISIFFRVLPVRKGCTVHVFIL